MSHIHRTSVSEKGLTAMIRRLGRDCRPLQFIREYVQNGIEAIQRTKQSGKILVDVNWHFLDDRITKTHKISFTDTGDGMTGEEIAEYINKLSSSGGENVYENYGMGAKIASITRNEAGIVYESWKNGAGFQALYRYDADEDAYGLEQLPQGNGSFGYYRQIDPDEMPELIRDSNGKHGTRVTLLGMTLDQDTMDVPAGAEGTREAWIYHYLNSRYFDIPDSVQIQVRIGYDRDRSNTKHNHLLNVRGQKAVLEKHRVANGVVPLSDAKVHWWLLKKDRQAHGRDLLRGHTGCLNQSEIFDFTDGRSNRAMLFGILFGARDVVLYVEPNGDYVQNTTRTGLVKRDGNALPWDRWADEFRAMMPETLKKYVEELMNATMSDSHEEAIRERLKGLREFYKLSRYRPAQHGAIEIDPDSLVESRTGNTVHGGGGNGTGSGGSAAGNFRELLTSLTKAGGVKGEESKPDPFPRLDWISVHNGTRTLGELEDRAARFIEKDNLILANKDFQGFLDVIEHFRKQWEQVPGAVEIVANQVYEQFEQQLIEVVAGALSFRGRKHWNPDEFKGATSDEALTMAVMTRYFIVQHINRVLRSKMGRPEATAPA